MREIKFRAWDGEVMGYSCNELESWYESSNEGWETLGEFFKTCYGCEIMQYTGLEDKNGVEIYEGDIINHWVWLGTCNGGSGVEKRVVTYGRHVDDNRDIGWWGWNINRETDLEVIGNIYENPELIK